MEPQAPIAGAVIVHDKRVLLIRRTVSEGTLSWQFPAGEIEPGETPELAAVRETAEEVGLTVSATDKLGERVHPATGRTMTYIACDLIAGTARVMDVEEIAELAWCSREQLSDYVPLGFYPPVQNYLEHALAS